ncbi:hypothetical protein EJ04DRAFT_45307 [Polyplosphaeria fusca]|uniref:Uncharacterized protein n=1 Tax=Polyplosphaeria fusca TaxID=682080 RepID=A0A9P4QN61_9PLEO|nr:hypothetical protein EJ04DRAFT_45307 [Polyplosphaeria fusca]
MLPPVDPGILERNPGFAVLYKDLSTRRLNSDGSTRDTKKQRLHDEIRKNLASARKTVIAAQILLHTLSELPSKAEELPPELHSVIEIVTAQLSGHISEADRKVLSGDTGSFLDNVDIIASAISTQLMTVASLLCRVADPIKTPGIDGLQDKASDLKQKATVGLPEDLATARVDLANTMYVVLDVHRRVLETGIKILEQTMHGSLARATKANSEHLEAKATALGLQARIHTQTHPPPTEFLNALKHYKASQGSTEAALRDREALANKTLELYEKAGEKAMRDIANRAQYLRSEISRTQTEIGKLDRV